MEELLTSEVGCICSIAQHLAQWIGPTQYEVMDLITHHNIDTYPQHDQGNILMEIDGQLVSYNCSLSRLNHFGESKLMELSTTVKTIDSIAAQFREQLSDPNHLWLKSEDFNIQKWMNISILQWLASQMNSDIAIRVLSIAIESVMGIDCSDCSFFGFLWTVATCGGYRNLVFTKGGAQQDKIKNSTKTILDVLIAKVGTENSRTGCVVEAIKQTEDGVSVRFQDNQKTSGIFDEIHAKYCIVAVPPPAIQSISFQPPLPSDRQTLLSNMTMGSILKIILVFKNHFWRDKNLSGELMGNGCVSFVFDGCHKNCTHHALICYAVGSKAKQFFNLPPQLRKEQVVSYISHLYGAEALDLLEDYVEHLWKDSAYFAVLKPCPDMDFVKDASSYTKLLTEPFAGVFWAGSETSLKWPGYMNGAIESGTRVAHQILNQSRN